MSNTYTGHHERLIGGENIAKHLWPTMIDESIRYNVPMPTEKQIALVVSALRMHGTMVHAGSYDRSELGSNDKITDFYPIESSIGRFFRDSAIEILEAVDE
jgi:hypothetical protein